MHVSKNGVAFIEGHEGFVARAYLDPAGVLTIGTGFTNRSGVFREFWGGKLKPGDRITRDQNKKVLKAALKGEYEPPVKAAMPKGAKQHEFDAAVSAVFNLGPKFVTWKAFQLWKAGEHQAAANHWAKNYNKAGGRKLAGLVRRREEEAHLFLTGVYAGIGEGVQRKETAKPSPQPDPVVEEAQEALKRFGFDPGAIDGWMGRRTKAAVLAYQKTHPHLTNDGIIGPATLAQLRRDAVATKETLTQGGGFPWCLPLVRSLPAFLGASLHWLLLLWRWSGLAGGIGTYGNAGSTRCLAVRWSDVEAL
ncbi:peptidoglycan binding domain-containing protein [Roseibium sp. TrichSKD4]|uniref:glycoside hydrolase family protein n=1 Tax=Roseibium sp. TrichSKD4 TaxID=744980 RepID=UPI0001E57551|nr:peptidoglycan-binding protein [Roseibium sp. TrichSKD4]EFO29369.1 peptidoglycan binding domain-containing protein [Roseibium sp. TrichSKD4]